VSDRLPLRDARRVLVPSGDGGAHEWHLVDRPGTDPGLPVVVCLHGNPTWSYLWSRFLTEFDPRYRVVAPDQLSMGYSAKVGPRPYRQRVQDLEDLLVALEITGPIWLVGQDWGGAIAMGWAVAHPDRLAGLVLSNTGIAVPEERRAPRLIRWAARPRLHELVTTRTPLFVRATPLLPGLGLTREQRRALAAPYTSAEDRRGVAGFVADVPFDDRHPSAAAIAEVADRLGDLDAPVRLWWGARDPVFDDSFAEDLRSRFRDVELHRVGAAGHLAVLETSIAGFVAEAIETASGPGPRSAPAPAPAPSPAPLWTAMDARAGDDAVAIADLAGGEEVTFADLVRRVDRIRAHLQARGVRPGDRLAILIPPGVDLIAVVYACWREGAVTVIADRGLGLRGLGAAVRSARVRHVVGVGKALTAARTLRWAPGATMIAVDELGRGAPPLLDRADPAPDDPAAVLFTSGATGPAKGVCYTHGQLAAQRDALAATYRITPDDAFAAAFAPFALYGPALGIATALPDMDVTAPATLRAEALGRACAAVGAALVFASPTALANVVATAPDADPAALRALAGLRLVLSAGAPVPITVLREMAVLAPAAELHTPYGMTEVLPVADLDLVTRERVGAGRGVCVGAAVPGCTVAVVPIAGPGDPAGPTPDALCATGETGEVIIAAPWMSQGYDRLWHTESLARGHTPAALGDRRWHRSGDLGHLDPDGNLWIEGRVVHLITTVDGPVTPVPLEIAAETVTGVRRAAAVGVGPPGVQQVVIVLETGTDGEAPAELRRLVRAATAGLLPDGRQVAAVWTVGSLPVDIRHNAKIDRAEVAASMTRILSGASR
jgi:olefin beta-lactone synthetase